MVEKKRKRSGNFKRKKFTDDGSYEKVVRINRISKTVAGGRRMRFNALVIVGDKKGKVGVGLAKAKEVSLAIDKARRLAQRHTASVVMDGNTIPHEMLIKFKAVKILLKPARRGRGIVAGQTLRAIAEAAGIKDLVTKIIGSANPVNVAKAAMKGLTGYLP
ncbi:MAG: 30S ribosomal protein S5 [Candidatus Omnitrophota bacterium]